MPERNNHNDTDLTDAFRLAFFQLAGQPVGVVAAFSGGSDSTALLHLLAETREHYTYRLIAAHLDHGLRGEESRRDCRAAEAEAERLGVEFFGESVDCRALAENEGLTLEEAGRVARYAFLERVRAGTGCDFVATGHTADDNAETVLMNLLRGAGPRGLAGIPPRRDRIVRPLLGFSRMELIDWLVRRRVGWTVDRSNLDPVWTRNRVRGRLLPWLEKEFNPSVRKALARTAEVLRDEERVWERLTGEARAVVDWREDASGVSMSLPALAGLEIALARRLILAAAAEAFGSPGGPGLDHVESVRKFSLSGRGSLDLPGGLRARATLGRLHIGPRPAAETVEFEYTLDVPGVIESPEAGFRLSARVIKNTENLDLKTLGQNHAALDLDRVRPPLLVRNPKPGDRFRPLGLVGTKKLSDFFIDEHIPAEKRPLTPLILDQGGILWVGGRRIDHRARVRPETKGILFLELGPIRNG